MSNVVELRQPCPFCGEQGEYDPDCGCVVCDGCQAEGPTASGHCSVDESDEETERAAWSFWNKRVESAAKKKATTR